MGGGEIAKMGCLGRNLFVFEIKKKEMVVSDLSPLVVCIGKPPSCVTLVVREGKTWSDLELQEASDESHGTRLGRSSGLEGKSPRPAPLLPHCLIRI